MNPVLLNLLICIFPLVQVWMANWFIKRRAITEKHWAGAYFELLHKLNTTDHPEMAQEGLNILHEYFDEDFHPNFTKEQLKERSEGRRTTKAPKCKFPPRLHVVPSDLIN
jgi:hypothetical protein